MTTPWSQNDTLFKNLVSEGHAWQALPYTFLKLQGFDVDMPDLTIRENISKAGKWLESYDLRIGKHIIEVKSRPFCFTNPQDWPSNRLPAFVDTVKKWEGRSTKPFAYIFISKPTGAMVATCALELAQGRWGKTKCWDRVRKFREEFYTVGREHLVGMNRLVSALRIRCAMEETE
jgi:hypothetical protein